MNREDLELQKQLIEFQTEKAHQILNHLEIVGGILINQFGKMLKEVMDHTFEEEKQK